MIGSGPLADATERALEAEGAATRRLDEPRDPEIRAALAEDVDRVVVISRFDHVSLRIALVVAHVRPEIPALVTVFDRDVAAQLRSTVKNVRVMSMGEIVAPSFAGPCLDENAVSLIRADGDHDGSARALRGVRAIEGEPRQAPLRWSRRGRLHRLLRSIESFAHPFDASAQILVIGMSGFLAVLILETVVTMAVGGLSLVDALYTVAKVTVTVGPSSVTESGPAWFRVFSTVTMLLTLGFAAVLTAGLVDRLLDARLTGIVGKAAVPRRDHVVVVGLGQAGLRLCGLLRDLGSPVVAIEQNADAKNVPRAKDQKLPVVLGSGSSQRVLRRLSIHRARALAAVTSDEVENIAIAVAARGLRGDLPIVLRAGDGDATTETQSLFRIGVVRDVYRIAGTALAAAALGRDVRAVFPYHRELYIVDAGGRIEPFTAP